MVLVPVSVWVCAAALLAVAARAAARELDPAACAARFDVQRDKIIRTEESRDMGARYLSELDVGSRHECRRLCCETDACDVFVYEEKSPGSCYLFACGPPEDFRCKFTAHGNFSSGVLALSRRLAELQDQERLAPPPPPPPAAPSAAIAPAPPRLTAAPPVPPRLAMTALPPPQPSPPASQRTTPQPQKSRSRCSRYEWECHTGGECIAVYNACDGVPQCADGSDEAPELGCPAAALAPAPAPARRPAPPASPTPPQVQPQPPPIYPAQMYEQEGGGAEPLGVGARAGAGSAGGEARWPHRLLQAQPHRYPAAENIDMSAGGMGSGADSGPHIFSHKGGLVQEPPFEPPAPPAWPRRNPHPAVSMDSGWGWGGEWGPVGRWGPPAVAAGPPRQQLPAPPAPLPQEQLQMGEFPDAGYSSRARPLELPLYGAGGGAWSAGGAPHDSPKKGPPPAPVPRPPAPSARPTENGTKKKAAAVHSESSEPGAVSVSRTEAHMAPGAGAGAQRDEHDGLSERPPAAIMLLVLGVCMTGALGVLVGSRARAARRRLRRGKPLAHDADYLVNGMYL